jgi:epoxyqueuosine reductase
LNRELLKQAAANFTEGSQLNYIKQEDAINESVCGMRIFDSPIFAFGAADDPYFSLLQEPSAIGKHFLLADEWLPQAKTVISFFLPFSEAVRKGNSIDRKRPSPEWLHGRVEGQEFVKSLSFYLKDEIERAGYHAVIPCLDERFWSRTGENQSEQYSESAVEYTSNWSERHVAFVCGLGTFGLSKGLITEAGMAGRFGSLVTDLSIDTDVRVYTEIYEYCLMCGDCAHNCPVHAISLESGKNHKLCARFLAKTKEIYYPRYGCGKCQVGVPCERHIPKDK